MGSAISFCNNKKYTHTHTSTDTHTRTHIHTKLQQRIINSHYEKELRHLAPQSSRKEDGLKYFMHHQMSNIGQIFCPKTALFENMRANTPWTSALTGIRQSARMDIHAWVCNYAPIGCFLLHLLRITEFGFINILTCIWKLLRPKRIRGCYIHEASNVG